MWFSSRIPGILLLALASCTIPMTLGRHSAAQQPRPSQAAPTAQPPQEAPPPQEAASQAPAISRDVIRSRLQEIEGNDELSQEIKDDVIPIYQQILTDLEARKAFQDSIELTSQRLDQLPARLNELTEQLKDTPTEFTPPDTKDLAQAQLDKKVDELQLAQSAAQSKLSNLRAESKRREDLRLDSPQLIAALMDTMAQLERRRTNERARTDVAPEIREAQEQALTLKLNNVALEVQQFRNELAYYDAAEEVLEKQIEVAQQATDRLTRELEAWRAEAERRRQASAAQDLAEKASQASEVPAELQPLADFNLKLSEAQQEVVQKINTVVEQLAAVRAQNEEWTEKMSRVQALIDAQAGVSESVGNLLREQREELPELGELRKRYDAVRKTLYEIRSDRFTANEELKDFGDLDARVQQELEALAARYPADRVAQLAPDVRSLLEARRRTLEDLHLNYKIYMEELGKLNVVQESMISLVERYTQYIDERVLWIRSIPPVQLSDVKAVPEALRWLVSADSWRELMTALSIQFERNAIYHALAALLLIVCFAYRSHGVRRIQTLGEQAAAKGCRNFGVTVRSLVWTLVVSAAGPALLSWMAWTLADVARSQVTEFAAPFATATIHAALAYWPFSFWQTAVRSKGLADSHFGWSQAVRLLIRRHLRWYVPAAILLTASYHLFSSSNNPVWERSLARFSLATLSICTTIVIWFLLSPNSGAPRVFLALHPQGWLARLRYIWFSVVVAVPATLAVQLLLGYQYTAERLVEYLFWSVIFISAMYLLHALASRWILISRRRLSIAQAKERMLTGGAPPAERERSELQGGVTENTQVDLTEVNAQTQRLLRTFVIAATAIGLFLIWIEVLPALARMNEVRLWRYAEATRTVTEDGAGGQANGAAPSTANGQAANRRSARVTQTSSQGWVTLGALVGSLVILTLTLVAVRNIPGLLEIVVLQHLPLDASIRFAITTVTRYALIIAGLAWAFTNIGFGWSKIQWLAAAISLGLGFGLQEIFANFVSGLILLFERPLRVGDIVTVGDVTGTVVQIRTRATTIRDWDRKELIVPNKEFITGQLLNWTLSDETNRIVIEIGVAYGSDIRQARDVVMNSTLSHPLVLKDPEPTVTFDLFGESALNLTLRCFVAKMADRLSVIHELHEVLYEELTSAGFSIPFPQRDIHLHLDSNGKALVGRTTLRNPVTDT